jgi:hypothetical protein
MKKLTALIVPVAAALTLLPLSCSKEYDLSKGKVDKTITLGGEQTALPLLTSGKVRFCDLAEGGIFESDADGNYFISSNGSFDKSFDVADFFDVLAFDGVKSERTIRFKIDPEVLLSKKKPEDTTIFVPVIQDETMLLKYNFESWRKEGVRSIDAISFSNLCAGISARLSYIGFADNIAVQAKVRLPERLFLRAGSGVKDGVLVLNGVSEGGKVEFKPVPVDIVVFNIKEYDKFNIVDTVLFESLDLLLTPEQARSMEGDASLTITSMVCGMEDGFPAAAVPEKFVGVVEHSLGEYQTDCMFLKIPEFLKSEKAVLDICDASFYGKLTSASNVPVLADIKFSASYASGKTSSFNTEAQIPAEGSSEVSITGKKMQSMFLNMPQQLSVSASARTDASQKMTISRESDLGLAGEFSFRIPLAFGSNMNLEFDKIINKVPDAFSTLLKNNSVVVMCEVQNTFPVDLEVTPVFLDVEGNDIGLCDGTLYVKGAEDTSKPVDLETSVSLKKLYSMPDIRQIVLHVKMTSETAPGRCVNAEDYLQCRVYLRLPDGLTINLNK